MKKFNISRRALALLLCLCMALASMALISCNGEEAGTNEDAAPADNVEVAEVLRVTKDLSVGDKVTEADLEVVSLRKIDIPVNAVTNKDDVVGKYVKAPIFKGELILASKVSVTDPSTLVDDTVNGGGADENIEYVLISKYDSLVKDGDYTAAINEAIEKNPGKAIYFPDGDYNISDTVVISGNAASSVSFRLSNYATIKAVNWSSKTKAMIRIGVADEADEDIFAASNTYIKGGVIDAAGNATGISLEGGKDIVISNVTVKNAYCGINLKYANNELGATYADLENIAVVGNGEDGSVGVLVDGTYNTLTNIKISDVQYGLKCSETGAHNVFKSVMAIGTSLGTAKDNAGYWDMSGGNEYDVCYSDQFAVGFLIEERCRSTYNACAVTWWSAENDYHVGFKAVDKLNATILYSKVFHDDRVETNAYILVGEDGGEGSVQYPIKQIVSTEYDAVLDKYCNTDILD
ncbi:MAG: hypothetical protein J6L85_02540 [Clostridia bacterium]|nr:hypothetical protein [Clostridia bacterium]